MEELLLAPSHVWQGCQESSRAVKWGDARVVCVSLQPISQGLLSSMAAGGGGGCWRLLPGRGMFLLILPSSQDSGDPQAGQNPPVWLTAWQLQSRAVPDLSTAQF